MPVPPTLSVQSSELALAALVKALRQAMRWREKGARDAVAGLSPRHGFQSSFMAAFSLPQTTATTFTITNACQFQRQWHLDRAAQLMTDPNLQNSAAIIRYKTTLQLWPSAGSCKTCRHHRYRRASVTAVAFRYAAQWAGNDNTGTCATQNEEISLSQSLRRVLRSVDSDAESSPASSPNDTRRRSSSVGQTNSVRLLRRASTSSVQSREDIEEREIEAAQAAARQFSASQAGARLEGNGAADTQLTSSSDDCHVLSDSSSDCDGSDRLTLVMLTSQNVVAEPNFQMKAVNYVLSQRVECDGRFSGWYRCREAELQRALDLVLIARATARQDAEAMAAALLRDSSFAAGGSGGGDCDSHKSQSNSAISTNDGNGKATEPIR